MPAETPIESDARILSLFDSPSEIDTPTPGVKAWVAGDTAFEGAPRPVIIKRVRDTAGMGQRKARATEALHLMHPHILRPKRWLADGGYLYVIRDVVRGKNLRQSLTTSSGERPGPELLRKLLMPMMETLTYSHGQGIVHGGISPENIIIAEDGRLLLVDFATTDPNAPRHQADYGGNAIIKGDIRALGSVLSAYLPDTGAFSNIAVRGRIEGLIRRCDTIDDLREILRSLEKLAAAPTPTPTGGMERPKDGVPEIFRSEVAVTAPIIGIPRLEIPASSEQPKMEMVPVSVGLTPEPPPPMTVTVREKATQVPQGGGGIVTLDLRNESPRPLILRMIDTQHAWLNTRPVTLPMTLVANSTVSVEFSISAARLTPGEYRSEVYLFVHGPGEYNEMTNTGMSKYISEVRVFVESGNPALTLNSQASVPGPGVAGRPPYPANAPRLTGGPGCAALPLLLLCIPLCLLPLMLQLFSLCCLR